MSRRERSNMSKWIRIISESGQIWEDGIKKRNSQYQDIVPDNAKGYIVLSGNQVRFMSDHEMIEAVAE